MDKVKQHIFTGLFVFGMLLGALVGCVITAKLVDNNWKYNLERRGIMENGKYKMEFRLAEENSDDKG